jgi:hypothetical protein
MDLNFIQNCLNFVCMGLNWGTVLRGTHLSAPHYPALMAGPCRRRVWAVSACCRGVGTPFFFPAMWTPRRTPPPKSFLAIAQFHTPTPNSSPQSLAEALVSPLHLLFDQGCWRAVDVPRFKVPAASSPILVSRPSMRCGSISVCVSTTSRSPSDAGTVTHRR